MLPFTHIYIACWLYHLTGIALFLPSSQDYGGKDLVNDQEDAKSMLTEEETQDVESWATSIDANRQPKLWEKSEFGPRLNDKKIVSMAEIQSNIDKLKSPVGDGGSPGSERGGVTIESKSGELSGDSALPQTDTSAKCTEEESVANKDADFQADTLSDAVPYTGTVGFIVGQKVEAKFESSDGFYPGTIQAIDETGNCDILFDDGDRDRNVPTMNIRRLLTFDTEKNLSLLPTSSNRVDVEIKPAQKEDAQIENAQKEYAQIENAQKEDAQKHHSQSLFYVGQAVEAKFEGSAEFYPGTVRGVSRAGMHDILFDDGDRDESVPACNIRALLTIQAEDIVPNRPAPLDNTEQQQPEKLNDRLEEEQYYEEEFNEDEI